MHIASCAGVGGGEGGGGSCDPQDPSLDPAMAQSHTECWHKCQLHNHIQGAGINANCTIIYRVLAQMPIAQSYTDKCQLHNHIQGAGTNANYIIIYRVLA